MTTPIETKIYLMSPIPDGASSLTNPGFETTGSTPPYLFNWSVLGTKAFVTEVTGSVHDGLRAVQIMHSGTWTGFADAGGIYQYITLNASKASWYRLSFWTRGDGAHAGTWGLWDSTNAYYPVYYTGTQIAGTDYTYFEYEFRNVSGSASMAVILGYPRFYGSENTGSFACFDDVRFQRIYPNSGTFAECTDVLRDTPVVWERGLPGGDILDLVADTGMLSFSLDNGPSNQSGIAGAYSPDSTKCYPYFRMGGEVKVVCQVESTGTWRVVAPWENGGFESPGTGGKDVFLYWSESSTGVFDETVDVYTGSHSARLAPPLGGAWGASVQDYWMYTGIAGNYYAGRFAYKGIGYAQYDGEYQSWSMELPQADDWTVVTSDAFVEPYPPMNVYFYFDVTGGLTLRLDAIELLERQSDYTEFVGRIASIHPTAGLFDSPQTDVIAHDWMGYLSNQELGVYGMLSNRGADEAIATGVFAFPIQPAAKDFDVGVETFLLVFNTDNPEMSMASFFQKMCRNEMGRLYLKGDGTLVFENRDARPLLTSGSFVLDGRMYELDVSYEQANVSNIIQVKVAYAEIDTLPTTRLWDLNGAPAILPGQTLDWVCPYTDPNTGERISAIGVSGTVAYEFGSAPDFVSDDMHAFLSQVNEVGGNSMRCLITNTHPTKTGYLNDWQIYGQGVYVYSPTIVEDRDQDSIDDGAGERRRGFNLEQITDPNTARNFAAYIKAEISTSRVQAQRISFVANQSEELALAALNAEISDRFTVIEAATGISADFYINRLRYTQLGPILTVDILAVPVGAQTWVWDWSHWDSEDGHWGL